MQDNNKPITVEEALKEVNSAIIALNAAVQLCEDSRQFMAVARLAIKNNNPELARVILTVMIERIDPFLQDLYTPVSDADLVDIVKKKMESKGPWPKEFVEFIELDESVEKGNVEK